MLRSISYRQFHEWMVYAELEPFDEIRADLRAAQIVSALYNVNRDKKKRREPFTAAELVLRFGDEPAFERPKQSWQQMKMIGQFYAQMSKSEPKRRRRREQRSPAQ